MANFYKGTLKRLKNESLKSKYGGYNVYYNDEKKKYTVYLENYDCFKFEIGDDYPWKPPKFYVNDRDYQQMLRFASMGSNYINEELMKKGINCLCCESNLCYNNWRPGTTLYNLIDEYKERKNLIMNIIYTKYIFQICSMFEIYCVEIPEIICEFL